MERSELVKILIYIKGAYGKQAEYPTYNEKEDGNTEDVWLDIIGHATYEDAMGAVRVLMQEGGDFPPKAPQIANKILENSETDTMTAEDAWETALYMCKHRHNYNQRSQKGIKESDRFRNKDEWAMQDEPEAFKKAVRSMGGLSAVTDEAYTNSFARKNFMNTFNSFKETIKEREIKQVAGVPGATQIGTESTEQIEQGLKMIGKK